MYHINWEDISAEDVPRMLADINQQMDGVTFDPNVTTIEKHDLPFYAEYDLLRVIDSSADPVLEKLMIYKEGEIHLLNWTNQPIYTVNEKAPIYLNEDIAPLYAKFFFDHVRGRHGRFLIIEDADEINWSETPPDEAKNAINGMITTVDHTETNDEGKMSYSSYMIFKDSLFKANIHVEKDGMVSLSDEALIVEGMPIDQDPAPGENIAE